jgi:hypothetical protein
MPSKALKYKKKIGSTQLINKKIDNTNELCELDSNQ